MFLGFGPNDLKKTIKNGVVMSLRIAIDGNIACGKSTLMQSLHQEFQVPIRMEPIADWYPILTKFYEDPNGWALSMNLQVMATFSQWKEDQGVVLYERCPRSCRDVFTALNIEAGHMAPLQAGLFAKLYKHLAWEPNVLVYLRTEPGICMGRLRTRARECESGVTLEYEGALHKKYEAMVSAVQREHQLEGIVGTPGENGRCRVFIVNGDQSTEAVHGEVAQILRQVGALEGRE